MMSILAGFVKGQSNNLPKIDAISLFSFLGRNQDTTEAKFQLDKDQRRDDYGDDAVGYVQVKHENRLCTVKAKITSEHSVSKKEYEVTVVCNEDDEEVLSAECDSCAATLGCCIHVFSMLTWLHRRSEEQSHTKTTCYWKESELSMLGKLPKFIKLKDLVEKPVQPLSPKNGSFLSEVIKVSKELGRMDTNLTSYYKDFSSTEKLSIHQLVLSFFRSHKGSLVTASDFLQYCSSEMSEAACHEATIETKSQYRSELWHELCYGRITASRAYESAHCQTLDDSLVDDILGPIIKDTYDMKQKKKLEVRQLVEEKTGIKIHQTGFYTSPNCPVMGASPDGISDDCIVVIKCPSLEKTMEKYISNGEIAERYNAQMQLLMYFAKKSKGLFCVANPDFKTSKEIVILTKCYDESYCDELIKKCVQFWKTAVFSVLEQYK